MEFHFHHHHDFPALSGKLDRIEAALLTIQRAQGRIMSAIADFAAKQNAHNAEVSADLDSIKAKVDDLNAQIATLQNSSGTISAEDQATLNAVEAAGKELADKADVLAGKTPPAPPTE